VKIVTGLSARRHFSIDLYQKQIPISDSVYVYVLSVYKNGLGEESSVKIESRYGNYRFEGSAHMLHLNPLRVMRGALTTCRIGLETTVGC
jgi:hypothetical protein